MAMRVQPWLQCTSQHCCAPCADAIVYLRGGSDTTHYLLYMPANSTGSAANFTSLAPKVWACTGVAYQHVWSACIFPIALPACACAQVPEQQFLVRDAPDSKGGGSYLYAVIYTAEERNGQLVVVPLGPDALVNATGSAEAGASGPSSSSESESGDSQEAGSSSEADSSDTSETGSSETPSSGWTVLQPHSRAVEIVDLTGRCYRAWCCMLCSRCSCGCKCCSGLVCSEQQLFVCAGTQERHPGSHRIPPARRRRAGCAR